MMSRALAIPSDSTQCWPRSTDAGLVVSGRFLVECSGDEGSSRGCLWAKMEAMRQVRLEKIGGLEVRR
jgi:hypothetical protein